jgi:hypothetical protein
METIMLRLLLSFFIFIFLVTGTYSSTASTNESPSDIASVLTIVLKGLNSQNDQCIEGNGLGPNKKLDINTFQALSLAGYAVSLIEFDQAVDNKIKLRFRFSHRVYRPSSIYKELNLSNSSFPGFYEKLKTKLSEI